MKADLPHLQGLTSSSGKDLAAEAQWARINALLAPVEAAMEAEAASAPRRPIIFILGPPRSGSTLLSQILAATGAFGFVSNVAARFWRAPGLGLLLERGLRAEDAGSSFRSVRGRTEGGTEPHEFGYFWSRWFDLGQDVHALTPDLLSRVDIAGLKRALAAMEDAAGKPLLFKNNTWLTFQADWLAAHFPHAVFVACRRDPFFVAQSLYEQRLAVHGDAAQWWSVRPAAYPALVDLPAMEQVAGQAVEIQRDMEKALAAIPHSRLIRADYARLCGDPRDVVREIAAACENAGERLSPRLLHVPHRFESTDRGRLAPTAAAELRELIAARLAAD